MTHFEIIRCARALLRTAVRHRTNLPTVYVPPAPPTPPAKTVGWRNPAPRSARPGIDLAPAWQARRKTRA